MKISTKGRYALRTMLDLAEHDKGNLIPLKEISKRQDITIKYLEQVMSLLSKAGYVRSVRGLAVDIVWRNYLLSIKLEIFSELQKAVWLRLHVWKMR